MSSYPSVFWGFPDCFLVSFLLLGLPCSCYFPAPHRQLSVALELRMIRIFLVPKFSELKKEPPESSKKHRGKIMMFGEFSHIGDGFFRVHYGWRCGYAVCATKRIQWVVVMMIWWLMIVDHWWVSWLLGWKIPYNNPTSPPPGKKENVNGANARMLWNVQRPPAHYQKCTFEALLAWDG